MTSHSNAFSRPLSAFSRPFAALAPLTAASLLVGCGGEEPAPQVLAPPPVVAPAAPPKPAVTPVDELMAQLGIDERVVMAEADAPATDQDRRAVLEFFDAFARGDHDSLQPMLTLADQIELSSLVDSGSWQATVDAISEVRIQTGDSPYGQQCALAVFEVGHQFQPQMWYFSHETDGAVFEAVMTPPNMIDRLSGADWIAAWHKVLEEEAELAQRPDEEHTIAQRNLDTGGGTGAAGPGPSGPGATPGAPGARPSGPIAPTTPAPGGPLNPTGR